MIQKNKNLISRILFGILLAIPIAGMLYLFVGGIRTNPDKILERNTEYILVKEYKWNNRDSVICKYPVDKLYTGVIINKEKTSHYVGVPGKGGHRKIRKHITVQFNETTLRIESSSLYNKYSEGDKVKVKEIWYPYHNITVL